MTLVRQRLRNDKLAVRLFVICEGKLDSGLAAFPVLHGCETQSNALRVQNIALIHILITKGNRQNPFIYCPRWDICKKMEKNKTLTERAFILSSLLIP
jgi:hypothetical protein